MSKLAINGGDKVRTKGWPGWPVRDESDVEAVAGVVQSGSWYRGKRVGEFESRFSQYVGTDYCICVSGGGTMALYLALKAAGVGPGDEVIIPPYTFVATASCVLMANAIPIFADIHPDSYCLDPDAMEAAITDKTKAVIPVHVCGCPADMDNIMEIAEKHGIIVIEDAAHAHGAEYKGRHAGSLGHMGCFSFQASKNLNCGDGGGVTTNDGRLAERCHAYHNVGRGMPGGEHSFDDIVGTNLRMTEFQGAILLSQFERLDEQSKRRDRNGLYLTEHLAQIPGIKQANRTPDVTQHGHHLYAFKFDPEGFKGLTKGSFTQALSAEGVPCGGGYGLLNRSATFQNLKAKCPMAFEIYGKEIDYANDFHLPVCEQATAEGIWFTQSMLLAEKEDMDDIIEAVVKIHDNVDELLQ